MEYKLEIPTRFVLRANPTWTEIKTGRERGWRRLRRRVRLARDAKTKLPRTLVYRTKDAEVPVRFDCQPRKVEAAGLTMDPKSYEGFGKVEPPSGTL